MKVQIEIDCTPEEARRFLGLPDVAPLHERVMGELEGRVIDVLRAQNPQELLQAWLPGGGTGLEAWQQVWSEMAARSMGFKPEATRPKRPDKKA